MAAADRADIVRDLFAAYWRTTARLSRMPSAEDFRFTTPYDDEIDKATYFERCWKSQRLDRAAEPGKDFRRRR